MTQKGETTNLRIQVLLSLLFDQSPREAWQKPCLELESPFMFLELVNIFV